MNPDDIFPLLERRVRRQTSVSAAGAAPPHKEDDDHASLQNPATSFQVHDRRGLFRNNVNELRDQGITVHDDNKPLTENTEADTTPNITPGEWKDLRQCICEGSNHNNKSKGKWNHQSLSQVALMDELQLWLLCFPVEYLENIVIKNLNEELELPRTSRSLSLSSAASTLWPVTKGLATGGSGGL